MAEEIAFENGRISKFEGLVTLTLTFDRSYRRVSPTYVPNCIEIEETFCGRTDVHTDGHLRPALLGRLCQTVDLKINMKYISHSIAGVIFTLAASSSKLNASVWCPSCLSYLLSNLNNYYIFIHRNGRKKYNNTKNNKN